MIPFTQYLRPDGRKIQTGIDRDYEHERKALELVSRGCYFETEVLIDDTAVFYCYGPGDKDEAILDVEQCPNGPEVLETVDRLVDVSYEKFMSETQKGEDVTDKRKYKIRLPSLTPEALDLVTKFALESLKDGSRTATLDFLKSLPSSYYEELITQITSMYRAMLDEGASDELASTARGYTLEAMLYMLFYVNESMPVSAELRGEDAIDISLEDIERVKGLGQDGYSAFGNGLLNRHGVLLHAFLTGIYGAAEQLGLDPEDENVRTALGSAIHTVLTTVAIHNMSDAQVQAVIKQKEEKADEPAEHPEPKRAADKDGWPKPSIWSL